MAMILLIFIFITVQTLEYSHGLRNTVLEHVEKTAYHPFRIHVHYHELDQQLNEQDISLLHQSVNTVVSYLRSLLAVYTSYSKLLLKRKACQRSWLDGPNIGKCALKRRNYVGEFCKGDFKIPDEHLGGLQVWQYNASEPRTWFENGVGVADADYILYVQALTTNECVLANYKSSGKSLIAYSADCGMTSYDRADENGRPVAGYINFCPPKLRMFKKQKHKLILTIIHEIIHVLGFSKDHFALFKDCSNTEIGSKCPPQRSPMFRKMGNYTRLLTNNVVKHMQEQFKCNKSNFGGPLDLKKHKYNDIYVLQSHWDGKLLYGSVMAPTMGPPELTFVDTISLALLEDSGWYKVNYSYADAYPWGREKGCNYASMDFDIGSCKYGNEMVYNGCNIYHTHRIECDGINTLDSEMLESNSCREVIYDGDSRPEFLRNDGFLLRCLLSNISNSDSSKEISDTKALTGTCFKIRCSELKKIEVIIDLLNIDCPIGKTVNIEKAGFHGIIVCPRELDLICFQREEPLYSKFQLIKPTISTTEELKEDTMFPKINIFNTRSGKTETVVASHGSSFVHMEKLCQKVFCTVIFCLLVMHLKMNGRILFCMF